MDLMRPAAWLVVAGCSSGTPRPAEDAKRIPPPGDAQPAPIVHDAPVAPTAPVGDVQVRVEWSNVPPAARSSPGKTACGTPRAPAVAPTTTWGIPEVLVIVDGAPGVPADARVRLLDCAIAPRLAIGSSLALDSAMTRPAKLVLAARRTAADLRTKLEAPRARPILLPIGGHEVTSKLEAGSVYELSVDEPGSKTSREAAWIVAANGAITDASGVVLARDVPVGTHAVRVWLPPRGGQPERHASGEVTVVAGDLAELTLKLAP
ncbi:MAG: hypothetical protein JWP01_249 [Myxococcales bacterium]|nr:hypothetical protein [Myxococcales bacterium]